jgi:methylamine--corrinoid protein Co-methyltransferase
MVLQETSASVLAAVASGLSIEMGGSATNKYEDRMTPVEPRIAGEVAHAVAGMKRSEANEIAKKLLGKYESKLNAPPLGKTMHECWNGFKKDLAGLGISLRPEDSV